MVSQKRDLRGFDFRDLAVKPAMAELEVIRCFALMHGGVMQRDRRPFHGTGIGRAEGSYRRFQGIFHATMRQTRTELFVGTVT